MTGRTQTRYSTSRLILLLAVALLMLSSMTVSAGAPPDFRLQDLDGNWFTLVGEPRRRCGLRDLLGDLVRALPA